jgi:hypothetical protein
MSGADVALLLGKANKHPMMGEEEAPESSEEGEDFEDLSPEEIVEHLHAAAEGAIKATEEKSPQAYLKAQKAIFGLLEAQKDAGEPEPKREPEDDAETED